MAFDWNLILDELVDRIEAITTTTPGEGDEEDTVAVDFVTVSRRLKLLPLMQPAELPAAFVVCGDETNQNETGRPPIPSLVVDIYLYVRDVDSDDGPEPVLLNLKKKIQDDLETEIIIDGLDSIDIEGFLTPTDLEHIDQTIGILTVTLHARG